MGGYSNFLYADPSFTEGIARLLDFGDTLTEYNRSPSAEQADAIALTADWNAVVDDLTTAFSLVAATFQTEKNEQPSEAR